MSQYARAAAHRRGHHRAVRSRCAPTSRLRRMSPCSCCWESWSVAARYHRGPSLLSCLASIAAFDFLFVPPYYTFQVHETAYLLTFAVMLVVALTMSRLTGVIREHAASTRERERPAGLRHRGHDHGARRCGQLRVRPRAPGATHQPNRAGRGLRADGPAARWIGRRVGTGRPRPSGQPARERRRENGGGDRALARARAQVGATMPSLLIVPLRVGAKSLGLVAIRPAPAGRHSRTGCAGDRGGARRRESDRPRTRPAGRAERAGTCGGRRPSASAPRC